MRHILCLIGFHKKQLQDREGNDITGTFQTIGTTLYEGCTRRGCGKRWWFKFDPRG